MVSTDIKIEFHRVTVTITEIITLAGRPDTDRIIECPLDQAIMAKDHMGMDIRITTICACHMETVKCKILEDRVREWIEACPPRILM